MPEGTSLDDAERERVLDAALELFTQRGPNQFVLHDIARLAGVDAATVVRSGMTVGSATSDAITREFGDSPDCPDTGSLRSDLCCILRTIVERMERQPRLLERLVEAVRDPHYITDGADRAFGRFEVYRPVFERAVARGEAPATYDLRACQELLMASAWARWLRGSRLPPSEIPAVVDIVIGGIAVGDTATQG
jgi:AcrR family transcriptional regulator